MTIGRWSFVIGHIKPAHFANFGPQPKRHMHTNEHPAARIEERLIDFAVRVIRLCEGLPKTYAGDHISRQVLRSGTAPAPHYGEARGAESRADFVHKLRIALKELNETNIWLKMLVRARLAASATIDPAIDEGRQLSRILTASIRTARRNAGTDSRPS